MVDFLHPWKLTMVEVLGLLIVVVVDLLDSILVISLLVFVVLEEAVLLPVTVQVWLGV